MHNSPLSRGNSPERLGSKFLNGGKRMHWSSLIAPFPAVVLVVALLADAGAQQASPAPSGAAACIGAGPIVGGYPAPPTPGEVRAREDSPACRDEEQGAPSVDFSPQAGHKLKQIYRKLQRIDHSQGDSEGNGQGGQ
jgi:hypothetical protein